MSEFRKLMVNGLNQDPLWKIIIDNFDKYWSSSEKGNPEIIPKKIHQIWFGGDLPEKYNILVKTFLDKNPDWEYKLWTDEDVKNFDMVNRDIFDKTKNLGSKSDIFRYEILYKFGGVYFDTDFICIKSLNDFLHLDLFTGTGHVDHPEAFNGLIGVSQGNPIIEKMILALKNLPILDNYNFDTIVNSTGPKFFSNILFDYLRKENKQKIVLFPTKFFYSFPAVDRYLVRNNYNEKLILSQKTEESYCVHLWYTSWQN